MSEVRTRMKIYLDNAATTPMHPKVVAAMLPYMNDHYGNASSTHQWGRQARAGLEEARQSIAEQLGASANQIIFTSGGTESDNAAIIGVALANQARGRHIITTQIEHHGVLHACQFLEQLGYDVTYLPVDHTGRVALATLQAATRPDTILVSIIYGNNEVGTIQDIHTFGTFLREKGIYFHVDAVQALGSIPVNVSQLPVDLLSFSAHKLGGPKGVGALIRAPHVKSVPFLHGGNQEKKRRAGTENIAGIVGFATALQIANQEINERSSRYQHFRNLMLERFTASEINFVVNGHPSDHLPHILNVSFIGTDTESLLINLDLNGIAASSGSACTSGSLEPSHVLEAMGLADEVLRSAIRFSFGSTNTEEQINAATEAVIDIVKRLVR